MSRPIWRATSRYPPGKALMTFRGTSEIPASSGKDESRVKKHPGDLGEKSYQRGIFLQNRGNSRVCWAPFADKATSKSTPARRDPAMDPALLLLYKGDANPTTFWCSVARPPGGTFTDPSAAGQPHASAKSSAPKPKSSAPKPKSRSLSPARGELVTRHVRVPRAFSSTKEVDHDVAPPGKRRKPAESP